MVTISQHNADANGDNSGERSPDIVVQPNSTGVHPVTCSNEDDSHWWELDHEGIAADDTSVLLPFFEEIDAASDATNADNVAENNADNSLFSSPEPASVYSGIPDSPPGVLDGIRAMLTEAWNIQEPKEWQLQAIFAMTYGLDRAFRRLLLVRRTGDGKSLVIYGLATLLRGVTIVMVPILALGSDQVSSVWSMANPLAAVYAEHLDSIRERDDVVSMARFLKSLRCEDKYTQSIVLWVGPDTLNHDVWKVCINSLIQHHLISCFVVDECHYIPTDGRFFRPNFHTAVRQLVGKLWNVTPMLFCSATFNQQLQYQTSIMLHPSSPSTIAVARSLGLDGPDIIVPDTLHFGLPTPFFTCSIHGSLGRSGINISVAFSNEWKSSFTDTDLYLRDGLQLMVYCQSSTTAVEKVKPFAQQYLANLRMNDCDTMSLTGGDGIMMKAFLVELFAGKIESDVCHLSIIAGTSAMNCGISSNNLYYIIFIGFPRRMSEMVQILGRLFRGPPPRERQDTIKWVLSLQLFMSLWVTSASNVDSNERHRQINELKQVVRFNPSFGMLPCGNGRVLHH